jgi:hypothetical protein
MAGGDHPMLSYDDDEIGEVHPEDRLMRGIANAFLLMAAIGMIYLLTRHFF